MERGNWLSESNSNFDRPTNWDIITKECVKALNSVGLNLFISLEL